MFAGISVTYLNDGGNKFKAKLNVSENVTCSPNPCQNREISGLEECTTANVHIEHESCTDPKKNLTLHVPPGKYKSMATCTSTKKVPCPACCLPGRPGSPGDRTGLRGRRLAGQEGASSQVPSPSGAEGPREAL